MICISQINLLQDSSTERDAKELQKVAAFFGMDRQDWAGAREVCYWHFAMWIAPANDSSLFFVMVRDDDNVT